MRLTILLLLLGCFWTQEYAEHAAIIFTEVAGGIGMGLLAGEPLNCFNYGEKLFIRHYIEFNYFSIYSVGSNIAPQEYDTLVYEYK